MDDLFGGLDDLKPEKSRNSKTDFMADLFGNSKNNEPNKKEFVLDEKYKKVGADQPVLTKKTNPISDQL